MFDSIEKNAIILVPQNEEDNIKCIELQLSSRESIFTESIKTGRENIFVKTADQDDTIDNLLDDGKINMIHCLVCNNQIEKEEECLPNRKEANSSYCIFNEEHLLKYSQKFLWQILSEILQKEINKDVHSEYICLSCFQILNDFDNMKFELRMIKSDLRNAYYETCENLKDYQRSKEHIKTNKKRDVNVLVGDDLFNIKLKCKKPRRTKQALKLIRQTDSNISCLVVEKTPGRKQANYPRMSYPGNSRKNDNLLNSNNEVDKVQKQQCDSCNFHTCSSEEMTTHRNTHFCNICGVFLTHPKQMRTHLIKVHNFSKQFVNQFQCNICHKKYSSSGSLHNHKKTIHGDAQFVCKICGRCFKHARLLATHEVRHKEKKIRCLECDEYFYFNSNLNKHINSVHRKVRAYQCPICFKYLCQRSSLTHHMSQHTNNKETAESNLQTMDYDFYEGNEASAIESLNSDTRANMSNKQTRINSNHLIISTNINQNIPTVENLFNKSSQINQINKSGNINQISNNQELDNINSITQMDIPVVSFDLDSSIQFDEIKGESDEVEISLNFDNSTVNPLVSANINALNYGKPLSDYIEPSIELNGDVMTDGQENKKLNLFIQETGICDDFAVNFFI